MVIVAAGAFAEEDNKKDADDNDACDNSRYGEADGSASQLTSVSWIRHRTAVRRHYTQTDRRTDGKIGREIEYTCMISTREVPDQWSIEVSR